MSEPKHLPKMVYVTYIASTPEKVWAALTSAEFTRQYFMGRGVEIEPKVGGSFALRMPDGRLDIKGSVLEWDPPRRLAVSWGLAFEEFRELPASIVSYDIEPMGGTVKLTMTEAHQWEVPDAILAGGRHGWPLILSNLKSVLETGKPITVAVKMEPPREMIDAIRQALATKPWRNAPGR